MATHRTCVTSARAPVRAQTILSAGCRCPPLPCHSRRRRAAAAPPPPPPPMLLLLLSAIGCGCGGLRRRECSVAPVPTGDDDHNVAVFQWAGRWGCLSVSNHASLRFRNPVYKTLRELTISYL
jgi:hypothetical protein